MIARITENLTTEARRRGENKCEKEDHREMGPPELRKLPKPHSSFFYPRSSA
jgi:hypothetical protein